MKKAEWTEASEEVKQFCSINQVTGAEMTYIGSENKKVWKLSTAETKKGSEIIFEQFFDMNYFK